MLSSAWPTYLLTFFVFLCFSCNKPDKQADKVTLALVDRGLFDQAFLDFRNQQYREFTAKTGVHVQLLPGPESAVEQLRLWRKLLGNGPETLPVHPDVFGVDVIWPGILGDDLLDLKPYVDKDLEQHFPNLVANWTVNGRLLALPSRLDVGVLYYRTDLLARYGYKNPPETWDDLERMAARIQKGERARGQKNFWGFIWQGAVSEALTCNALEWQNSEGGGQIVDAHGQVSVNNERAIRSWDRAARWVGTISPPGVTTYKETDAINLWTSGGAAFMRNWTGAYVASGSERSVVRNQFRVALLPRGQAGRAGVFGGDGYSVSKHSTHPKEAVELVRYLCSREMQALQAKVLSTPPTIPSLYKDADLQASNHHIAEIQNAVFGGMVARPSTVVGGKYIEVSAAFSEAVHSVLTHEKDGTTAARNLEARLNEIMKSAPPVKARAASTP
jgi:trehalose/maltose transport system substrate-binding protein